MLKGGANAWSFTFVLLQSPKLVNQSYLGSVNSVVSGLRISARPRSFDGNGVLPSGPKTYRYPSSQPKYTRPSHTAAGAEIALPNEVLNEHTWRSPDNGTT